MMKERYCKYGATINDLPLPEEYRELKITKRKTSKMTNTQKVLAWINKQPQGRVFKIADLMKELELTNRQLQKVKNSSILKTKFENMHTDIRGYYQIR